MKDPRKLLVNECNPSLVLLGVYVIVVHRSLPALYCNYIKNSILNKPDRTKLLLNLQQDTVPTTGRDRSRDFFSAAAFGEKTVLSGLFGGLNPCFFNQVGGWSF
jgi:hypothetical protein